MNPRALRPAAVAGTFYPADPHELRTNVDALLAAAAPASGPPPKALVAPHAGYLYSGPVAASAFRQLSHARGLARRVVLLGPSHYVGFEGLAAPSSEAFATPLGTVAVDRTALDAIADLPQVTVSDRAHLREHSLEVELPFLQRLLGDFALVPLVVGDAEPGEVAAVLDRLWGGDETVIVISTDLSHYLDGATATRRDTATTNAILALAPERIGVDDACGRNPLRGLLVSARARGLTARLLDQRHSGDTAGPSDRVVGYGAYAFA
jgi:hypothetical protein